MSFSNLFTKLSNVEEEEPRHRNETNLGTGSSRKRKPQKQPGSFLKRQCLRSHAAVINAPVEEEPTTSEAHRCRRGTSRVARPSVSSAPSYNNQNRSFRSNNHNKRNTNNANNQKNECKGRKQRESAQRFKNSDRDRRGKNMDFTQPQKRFMTQEFKDQHVLEVEGRLLCKYFVLGRCTKGENCQLEHPELYNDLIKEACKFYIQESCYKGAACPYMHKSIPCKYFHKHGKCKSEDCRFSHDPLTDVTQKVFEATIQRENEFAELSRKAEEPVSQTTNEQQNTKEDIVIPAVRPSFYQSSETAVEDETSLSHNELQTDITEEDSAPQTENNIESEDSLASAALEQPGPVCYSVEAILGPQLFKPVLYTATKSQKSSHSPQKTTTERFLKPANAPYSVASIVQSQSGYTSHLCTPPVPQPASRELKARSTRAMDNKCNISYLDSIKHQNVQQKLIKQPPTFPVTAASSCDEQCHNMIPSGIKMSCEPDETKEASNLMTEHISADCKRQHLLPIDSSVSQKSPIPNLHVDKLGECGQDSKQSDDTITASLNTDKSVSKSLPAKLATTIQENLNETTGETSVNGQSSHTTQNVAEKKQDSTPSASVPPPHDKATSRFTHLFANLNSDLDRTSSASSSFSNKLPNPKNVKKSNSCSQKFQQASKPSQFADTATNSCKSPHNDFHKPMSFSAKPNSKGKHKNEDPKIAETPATSFQSLFTSLTADADRPLTVDTAFSDKPAVSGAKKLEKSNWNRQKALQGTKPSQITEDTKEIMNSSSSGNKRELGFVTAKSTGKNKKDCVKAANPPNRSFQSLFETLTPKPEGTSSVCESFNYKPEAPSSQNTEKSKWVDCVFNPPTKASQYPRSKTKSGDDDNADKSGATLETSNNSCLKSVSSSVMPHSKNKLGTDVERDKTSAKSFQSLFAAPLNESINDSKMLVEPQQSLDVKQSLGKRSERTPSQTTLSVYKRTEESKNEQEKETAASRSSNASNKTSASQSSQPHTAFQMLFQQLPPYEQQEHH